jgi:hypothetical protein
MAQRTEIPQQSPHAPQSPLATLIGQKQGLDPDILP